MWIRKMKVLICGSRKWADEKPIKDIIDSLPPKSTVITGGALGADSIAENVALKRKDLKVEVIYAKWQMYGKLAGPKRNIEMLEEKPDIVYAFPDKGSKGTYHTIREAEKRGIKVVIYENNL